MNKLIKMGKDVKAIFVTSGDYAGQGDLREKELSKSMETIGVKSENVHLLRIHEREILDSVGKIVSGSLEIAKVFNPDCIIGQDYEGGHNGHDAISFATQEVVKKLEIKNFYVFPVYWGYPNNRKGATFKPERTDFITIPNTDEDKELKRSVKEIHASQIEYFSKLEKIDDNYLELLFSREVFFKVEEMIDFKKHPTKEIGYTFSGQFIFESFQAAIEKY
jgi:LmbE family N-acetylglucosaminyl deacetylase